MLAFALGAGFGYLFGIVAVMAKQTAVASVPSQGNGAVYTLDALSAGAAGDEAGESAPVQEHDSLFP